MAFQIYLVEDEDNLNHLLKSYLEKEGWKVCSFFSGEEARLAMSVMPDLWILDIMLPDTDGYQLIDEIKKMNPSIPIIFISARDADLDRVIGLEKGSDDYLAKPFLPRELVIRTRKLLERVYKNNNLRGDDTIISYSSYEIDPGKRMVYKKVLQKREKVDLTSKEFDILYFFVKNFYQALSREQILNKIWGNDYYGTTRAVDDLVRRVRKKMPELNVETIYGYGYRLVQP